MCGKAIFGPLTIYLSLHFQFFIYIVYMAQRGEIMTFK